MLQNFFGIATVAYLCLGAAGAGLASVAAASYLRSGARFAFSIKMGIGTALILLFFGMVSLLLDLGRPSLAFYLALFSNLDSWAARGFWLLFASVLAYAAFFVVLSKASSEALATHWDFYRRNRNRIGSVLSVLSIVLSAAVALYTGFLLYESLGVLFWRTLLLPMLFLSGAVNIGLCLFLCFKSFSPPTRREKQTSHGMPSGFLVSVIALLVEGLLLVLYLTWASDAPFVGVAQSFEHLVANEFSLLFWFGVVGAGLLVPLLVALVQATSAGKKYAKVFASTAALGAAIGLIVLRYGIVFSGITQF